MLEAFDALGKQGLLIAGENNRKSREAAKSLPRKQLIAYMAQHAIANFLGGELPKQNV